MRQYQKGKTHAKQGFKTIIKPAKEAQARHSRRIGKIVRNHKAVSQAALIAHLNPVIRGWANYYSNACSKVVYNSMDARLYHRLRAWARRRHPQKNQQWIAHKYWLGGTGKGWVFACHNDPKVFRLSLYAQTPIQRHVKVQGGRSPYDGDWVYWSRRRGLYPTVTPTVARLLKHQGGQCFDCGLYFGPEDLLEIHHLDKNPKNNKRENLALVHRHCHDEP